MPHKADRIDYKESKDMAFVNEKVPQNERREFRISRSERVTPKFWTIDREKKAILFDYWTNIDKPSEIEFAFVWKEKVFDITFYKETYRPNIVKWTIESMYIPPEYKSEEKDIMDALRDAMRVYGFSGFEYFDQGPIEVIINF